MAETSGMSTIHTEIIKAYGCDNIACDLNIKAETVKKWRTRRRIPAQYWMELIKEGKRRRVKITLRELAIGVSTRSRLYWQ